MRESGCSPPAPTINVYVDQCGIPRHSERRLPTDTKTCASSCAAEEADKQEDEVKGTKTQQEKKKTQTLPEARNVCLCGGSTLQKGSNQYKERRTCIKCRAVWNWDTEQWKLHKEQKGHKKQPG